MCGLQALKSYPFHTIYRSKGLILTPISHTTPTQNMYHSTQVYWQLYPCQQKLTYKSHDNYILDLLNINIMYISISTTLQLTSWDHSLFVSFCFILQTSSLIKSTHLNSHSQLLSQLLQPLHQSWPICMDFKSCHFASFPWKLLMF